MSNLKNGARERRMKREHRARCKAANLPCWLCKTPINYDAPPGSPDSFQSDHKYPVSTRPDMAYVLSALRPSHASCNKSRGAKPVEETSAGGQWVKAEW